MNKKLIAIEIISIFLLTGLATAFENMEYKTTIDDIQFSSFEEDDRYYDVFVFVFGRCNCIGYSNENSDRKWEGGLYIGFLSFAWASIYGGTEWMYVLIHNKTGNVRYFKRIQLGVNFLNTTGIFFWASKGGYSPIPPRIFIICHCEMARICQNWDE